MNYNYSIICEDITQLTFIKIFLERYSDDKKFILNQNCYYQFKCKNKQEVLKSYSNSSILAFRNYSLDFLLVGFDYDDRNRKQFNKELEFFYKKLPANTRNKTIIFLPVQAIEHWLLYIKYNNENKKTTKNITLENIDRKKAKFEIYGTKRPHKKLSEIKTDKILQNFNIDWLVSKSESFKYFYNNFNDKIKKT